MPGNELREKFLDFFAKNGHIIVPSSSLMPDDPSVLLTTAGMQQFVPYFTGVIDPRKDFGSRRVASIQKAFRTVDIDEVSDDTHLTFFEMLGHFSFGDYFKKETIEWTFEFLTKTLKVSKERISATVFAGNDKISFDKESYDSWLRFLPEEKIKKGPQEDNIWGPAGAEGICGAANEVYVDGMEVATLVFMEYFCAKDGFLTPLPQKGVDVGWGFERVAMIAQNKKNIFETDLLTPYFRLLQRELPERTKRIMIDHLRGSMFLIADGVRPSNKDRGYILRRLMRRVFVYEYKDGIPSDTTKAMIHAMIRDYGAFYSELLHNSDLIYAVVEEERVKFFHTLKCGLKELESVSVMTGKIAFDLYQSYGIPPEVTQELKPFDREEFEKEKLAHEKISQQGAEKKFGGHGLLLNTGELKAANKEELQKVTRLHTATHLLQAALRKVLGEGVRQMGSDITAERTRFDFSFNRKLTDGERKKIEDAVNDIIQQGYDVTTQEMPYQEAIKQGALHFFSARGGSALGGKEKYPERVKVYQVGDFSKELCGGPHVQNTNEIGRFRILKEEAVASGVRRIRATVESY